MPCLHDEEAVSLEMVLLWRLDKEVEGALIPDSMQRVSKCKLVGFCGAAAR